MKKAVFIGDPKRVKYVYSDQTICTLLREAEFPFADKVLTRDDLSLFDLRDVHYLFSTWGMLELTEQEIKHIFPSVEAIFYAAGSVQKFARPFLKSGIRVFSAWAANGVAVAEYTLAQIILASKGYFSRLHIPASGGVMSKNGNSAAVFSGNYDMTVGIIGAGMIGRLVIERIHKILEHIEILVFDPFMPQEKADELGITLCDLHTLFSNSDVITNHLANNSDTVGMLNGSLFALMKPFSVFINTGRGAQVVEAELIKALKDVPTRTALLDVTFPEPPQAGSELYEMSNVFLTPHIAGSLGNEVHRMGEYMLREFRLVAEGKPVQYEVTLDMLKTMA